MMRYFIYLAYNGANYCGWQVQPNGESVQAVIERALSLLMKAPTAIQGAGRTDAGVHAKKMVAHFDTTFPISSLAALTDRLNCMLPRDIVIYDIRQVRADAHARFDAISRTYHYHLVTCKNPFMGNLSLKVASNLNFDAMNAAAHQLLNYTDFTSFSKLHTDVKTNNCHITKACWEPIGEEWRFIITADRFLRNMVRAIVGTLLDVGRGKLDIAQFCTIIESKDRAKAGSSAPAQALFLVDITYPQEIFIHL